MKSIIIVRHGNTFKKGDTILRVGKRTDLDLVESEKGIKAGNYINDNFDNISKIITGPLKRQTQTANLISSVINYDNKLITIDERLNELDYGIYDGQPEELVKSEIGKDTLAKWDSLAIPPECWPIDIQTIHQNWKELLSDISSTPDSGNTIIVTSNGIIRFLPEILGIDKEKFKLKVPTGGIVILQEDTDKAWQVKQWGIVP